MITEQQLAEYNEAIMTYQHHVPVGFNCCSAHPAAEASIRLYAEVLRLRAAVTAYETARETP